MSEVASAYVSLMFSAKGARKQIESQLGGELGSVGERQGKQMGGKLTGALGGVMKRSLVGIGAAGGAALGASLFKGFQRLSSIEQAEASLRGLGHSAASVEKIMSNALAAVEGTAFGLGDAASVAASVVAAGVKPGQDLERTLRLVGDAATIAGTDLSSMGAIFGKAAASNKVQMDIINQLHDAGVPALALLADQMGVTAEEASKMASEGKIDFATFQRAIQDGMGGAALEAGDTVSGSFANMQAALGRVGAKLLGGLFPKLAGGFGGITQWLDKMGPTAEKVGAAIGDAFTMAGAWVQSAWSRIRRIFASGDGAGGLAQIRDTIESLWKSIQSIFSSSLVLIRFWWDNFGQYLVSTFLKVGAVLLPAIRGVLKVIEGIFNVFAGLVSGDWSRMWAGIEQILSGAWAVIKGVVRAGWAVIRGLFSAASAAISGIVSALWSGVKRAFTSGVNAVGTKMREIKGKVTGAMAGAGTWLLDAGKRLIDGLIRGIKSKIAGVGSAMSSVASKIKGFLPGSPIKEGPLTSWNGGAAGKRLIDQGIISGISARQDAVGAALGDALGISALHGGAATARSLGAGARIEDLAASAGEPVLRLDPRDIDAIANAIARRPNQINIGDRQAAKLVKVGSKTDGRLGQ